MKKMSLEEPHPELDSGSFQIFKVPMYKKFLCIVMIFLTAITICGCSKNKSAVLLNKSPITKETLLNNSVEFNVGDRVYYIFITEKQLETKYIRIRIMRRDEKAGFAVTKLAYANDFRLYKDQVYYYNNYVVLNEAGYYTLFVYSKDDLRKPMAMADFRVKN